MKVAIVHDWLIHMRGGEKVLDAFAELYPDATIYTLFCKRSKLSSALKKMKIKTSFLQYLPGIRYYYRWLLPILPLIVKTIHIEDADVVLSSSHCVVKAVKIPKGAVHVCYCHTPMRYLWGFGEIYFKSIPFFLKPLLNVFLNYLRKWDVASSKNVDYFIANSKNVAERINRIYEMEAKVIYPPVDNHFYQPEGEVSDYYLIVSAFVPYKRVDLVIEAFNELNKNLLIVGSGPMQAEYLKLRKSPRISFLGAVPGNELRRLYAQSKAVLFPTNEDFGIVPLEAQACGAPVIAFGEGGALESVQEGVFFHAQTPDAISGAVIEFEKKEIDRSQIPDKIDAFGRDHFMSNIHKFVTDCYKKESDRDVCTKS